MKRTFNIILLAFYILGNFCLPMGDFSLIQDIPEMYNHCKETEDNDMEPIDFITDHLVNIDSIFDQHNSGDEQKPHEPFQKHHQRQVSVFFIPNFSYLIQQIPSIKVNPKIHLFNLRTSNFISKIFHPPIA